MFLLNRTRTGYLAFDLLCLKGEVNELIDALLKSYCSREFFIPLLPTYIDGQPPSIQKLLWNQKLSQIHQKNKSSQISSPLLHNCTPKPPGLTSPLLICSSPVSSLKRSQPWQICQQFQWRCFKCSMGTPSGRSRWSFDQCLGPPRCSA